MRIILAGIGMGAREQMTQAVQEACMNADIIFGAAKVLETVEWCATPKEAIYEAEKIYAYLQEHLRYCSPVVIFQEIQASTAVPVSLSGFMEQMIR